MDEKFLAYLVIGGFWNLGLLMCAWKMCKFLENRPKYGGFDEKNSGNTVLNGQRRQRQRSSVKEKKQTKKS